jgi:OPA family glycerol-3-phosphate transporter-like MFS transporter
VTDAPSARLRRWRVITLLTLTFGYVAFYFCRSNLSVVSSSLVADPRYGLDAEKLGRIVSAGVLSYGLGKLLMGTVTDFVGGRVVFLVGMVGSALATLAFGASSSVTAFTLAWCASRFFQSGGWGALVKIASRWYSPARMGAVMAVLCLSYPIGDFVAKLTLGRLLTGGADFRAVFRVAAAVLLLAAVFVYFLLRGSPSEIGEAEPKASERNVYAEAGDNARPESLRSLLGPLLRSPAFWIVCFMSFGLTVIREAFTFWSPLYLVQFAHAEEGRAAQLSSAFPFFGGISIVCAGLASDRLAAGRRGLVMVLFLVVSTLAMAGLAWLPATGTVALPVMLISLVGLAMTGPYAFLSGVVAVDIGGKRGSSSVAGIADAVGYVGAAASSWAFGYLAKNVGWTWVFGILAVLSAVTCSRGGRSTPGCTSGPVVHSAGALGDRKFRRPFSD